jgi:Regulator of chromosome condensation (RCC1) repeat
MKFASRNNHRAHAAFRAAASLLAVGVFPFLLSAAAPTWWSQRGVLVEHAGPDDFAPANQGQVKNIARAAVAEMDAKLSGGAGDELHNLISSWLAPNPATNDFAPVNLGQLKHIAKPFYNRLISVGCANSYPWLASNYEPDDFTVSNIGQVKNLFGFEIPNANALSDPDQDRLACGERSGNLALEPIGVWFWKNHSGNSNIFETLFPRRLSSVSDTRSVAAGDDHLVILTATGTVLTWEKNSSGH